MTKTVAPGRGAIPADRFAALLRGINVGRAKRVAMADLRGDAAPDARFLVDPVHIRRGERRALE